MTYMPTLERLKAVVGLEFDRCTLNVLTYIYTQNVHDESIYWLDKYTSI